MRYWLLSEETKAGVRNQTRVDKSVCLYDTLLLVLSERSIASQWIEPEVTSALAKEHSTGERVLFPILVGEAARGTKNGWAGDILGTHSTGDFRQWQQSDAYQSALERLLGDLEVLGRGRSPCLPPWATLRAMPLGNPSCHALGQPRGVAPTCFYLWR